MKLARFLWIGAFIVTPTIQQSVCKQQFCVTAQQSGADKVVISLRVPKTTGWVGFGTGSEMEGSDIVMAWLKDGNVILSDRYANSQSQPLVDDVQVAKLVKDGSGIDGDYLVVKFERPLAAAGTNSVEIKNERQSFIWAIGNTAPNSDDFKATVTVHGQDQAGSFLTNLLAANGTFPGAKTGNGTGRVRVDMLALICTMLPTVCVLAM